MSNSRTLLAMSLTLLSAATASPVYARQTPEVVAVAKGDSVRIFLLTPPPVFDGFNVYGGATGTALTKLTPTPVVPAATPEMFVSLVGADMQSVMRRTEAADVITAVRKLKADDFTSSVMSVL